MLVCQKLQNRTWSGVRDEHNYDCVPTIRHAGTNRSKYWNQTSNDSYYEVTFYSRDIVMFVRTDVKI